MVPATVLSLSSQCIYNDNFESATSHYAATMFLDLGGKLLEQGKHDEAMAMFDSSFNAMNSPANMLSKRLHWGNQQLVNKPFTSASQPVDTYQEDECDVGPRPFTKAMVPGRAVSFDMLRLIICYNKALVHHSKGNFTSALEIYNVITTTVTGALANNLHSDELLKIVMRAYNNMGQICYGQREEEAALLQFETALVFSRRIEASSIELSLDYANVLSNWCRVQWMLGDVSNSVYVALEEVLRIRSSLLAWEHVDVASAHYNLGVAEYSRHNNEKAMTHLMQYLAVASQLLQRGEDSDLDPIPCLTYVLLIKNDNKNDKTSQDLMWGLRALQEKRQDLGPHDTEVASVLNFIGTLLFQQRELDHALLFFQEELRLEEQAIGKDDVSVSVTCNNIGRILQELGRYVQAIHYYQRSLRHQFGNVLPDVEVLKGKGDMKSSFIADVNYGAEIPPATMNLYSTVWYNLGLIHDKMGAYVEAIKAFQMSLKLRRAMLGRDHADVACLLYNIGVLQMEQQMLNEATVSFREALRIRRVAATGQLNDRHVVKTLQKLASLHKSKGNIQGALGACEDIMQVLKVSVDFDCGSKAKIMATTLRDISELHHAQGNVILALETALASVSSIRSNRCSGNSATVEHVNNVEQETATLLLVGSLQHETCEPLAAQATFMEAARIINDCVRNSGNFVSNTSSLLPLLEVSNMLASAHCAPEA